MGSVGEICLLLDLRKRAGIRSGIWMVAEDCRAGYFLPLKFQKWDLVQNFKKLVDLRMRAGLCGLVEGGKSL